MWFGTKSSISFQSAFLQALSQTRERRIPAQIAMHRVSFG